jgi:hypothetical protein
MARRSPVGDHRKRAENNEQRLAALRTRLQETAREIRTAEDWSRCLRAAARLPDPRRRHPAIDPPRPRAAAVRRHHRCAPPPVGSTVARCRRTTAGHAQCGRGHRRPTAARNRRGHPADRRKPAADHDRRTHAPRCEPRAAPDRPRATRRHRLSDLQDSRTTGLHRLLRRPRRSRQRRYPQGRAPKRRSLSRGTATGGLLFPRPTCDDTGRR